MQGAIPRPTKHRWSKHAHSQERDQCQLYEQRARRSRATKPLRRLTPRLRLAYGRIMPARDPAIPASSRPAAG